MPIHHMQTLYSRHHSQIGTSSYAQNCTPIHSLFPLDTAKNKSLMCNNLQTGELRNNQSAHQHVMANKIIRIDERMNLTCFTYLFYVAAFTMLATSVGLWASNMG